MYRTLLLTDFILFVYIYIGTRWVGWSIEEALSSKTGFVLLVFSAFLIAKKGLAKPFRIGKTLIIIGMILLLTGFAMSLQVRKAQHFVLAEGENFDSTILEEVTVQDSPGLIRNDIYAKINFKNIGIKTIKIMPASLIDGYLWRIIRFGYTPIFSVSANDKLVANNSLLILATNNWTSDDESLITEAGLTRNPPPRIMLGVGHFPPEMEALLDFNQFGIQNENLFIRISKTTFEGRSVSLEGDDYWRYLVNGRLKNPVLKIALIKNKKTVKAREVKIGDTFDWDSKSNIKFNDLKYWVEIERRWDPFIPVIIASFLITYLGIAISIIQYIANIFRSLRAKRVGKKCF